MSLLEQASLVVTPNGYKASKLYSVIPSTGAGDMDVVRATTATRVNSTGLIESVAVNVPRIDYTNGSCPSILVEPQRTNLVTYSNQFDNAAWSKEDISVSANASISPSGIQDAHKLVPNTNNNDHTVYQLLSSGGNRTFSVYAKADGFNYIFLGTDNNSASDGVFFNLTNGTISQNTSSLTASIQSVGNGWYRCNITSSNWPTIYSIICTSSNGTSLIHTGNGTSGVLVWGAQVEVGSYATSYIPTVASSVTRNADVISKTGISSLIGQTEGTLFVDVNITRDDSFYLSLGTLVGADLNIYICLNTFIYTGNIYAEIKNTTQQALIMSSINSGRCKIALAYKANDIALYINGNLIGTDTSATIPATSAFSFEYDVNIGNRNTKNYNSALLFKTRLTNTELASLTTL